MKIRVYVPVLTLLGLAVASCAMAPRTEPPRETVAHAVTTGLSEGIWPGPDVDLDTWRQERLQTLLAEPLDTAAALEIAALSDFEIVALLAELDAQRAATEQAGLLPNPVLRFMTKFPERGRTELDYGLMQDLVETLTRGRRLAIAEAAERAAAYRTAETIMLRLWLAEAAYVEAVAAGERADLWTQRGELAGERAELARALAARGILAQDRAAEQQARAARILQTALQAGDDAGVAKARLAETMGLASAGALRLPEALPEPPGEPESPEPLREAALRLRLDLLAAQATALRDEESLELIERWRYLPGFGLGVAGSRYAENNEGLGAEIALTVPLFDRGQARLAGAKADHAASQARIEARQRQVQAGVDRAFAAWQREQRRLDELEHTVQPELAQVLALRERSYRDGLADRFAVLDAADDLLALAIEQLDASEARWLARIELARQTGSARPVSELGNLTENPTGQTGT